MHGLVKAWSLASWAWHDAAMQAFDQALSLNPDCAGAWYSEGPVFRFTCRLEERVAGVLRMPMLNPDTTGSGSTRASELLRSEHFEDAVQAYDEEIGQGRADCASLV